MWWMRRERRTNHTIRRDPIEREHSKSLGSEVHARASRQPASERGPVAFPEAGAASRRCDRRELMTTQSAQRWTGAVLALLIVLGAAEARAQYPGGNVDNDGALVPKFEAHRGGSVSVSNSGQGVVVIPLTAPPGVRGMAPRLSLRYSSGSGDEGLGLGWAIDLGVPDSVRRTTRFGVPKYTDQDVFSYGGQDLVYVGDVAGRRRYKTRTDSFQRIERSVTAPDDYGWVVFEKDGRRLEYGTTGNARSMNPAAGVPSPGIYAWHLSRVVDTFGNAVEFTYEGPPLVRRLSSIRYTVNGSRVVGPEQKVVLTWDTRPDPISEANYGNLIIHDKRLDLLSMMSDNGLVRQYELDYRTSAPSQPLTSLLLSVTESAPDGTAMPAWSFEYSDHDGLDAVNVGTLPTVNGTPVLFVDFDNNASHVGWRDTGVRAADVNGDGLIDLVRADESGMWVVLNNGSGWGNTPASGWVPPCRFVSGGLDQGTRLIDVNGDGLPDVLRSVINADGTTTRAVYMNTGGGWEHQRWLPASRLGRVCRL